VRCYFIKANKIEGVELLQPGADKELIAQAERLLQERAGHQYDDGVEIWAGRRFVYRSQPNGPSKEAE
jgi:hypothetical protein